MVQLLPLNLGGERGSSERWTLTHESVRLWKHHDKSANVTIGHQMDIHDAYKWVYVTRDSFRKNTTYALQQKLAFIVKGSRGTLRTWISKTTSYSPGFILACRICSIAPFSPSPLAKRTASRPRLKKNVLAILRTKRRSRVNSKKVTKIYVFLV